jgi:hypothetical protein
VSTLDDIKAAVSKLSPAELGALRDWIDEFLEDSLELSDEAIAAINESKREIASGKFNKFGPRT